MTPQELEEELHRVTIVLGMLIGWLAHGQVGILTKDEAKTFLEELKLTL